MVLHRPNGTVTLEGEGLDVEGKIEVTWDVNGVHVRPANKMQKTKGALAVRKKVWYAVVLPTALLSAIAQRTFSAEQEALTISGTITGVLFNPSTVQYELVTLPLPNELPLFDSEEYQLELQVNNGSSSKTAQLASGRDLVIFGFSLTYNYDAPREPCSYPKWVINIQVKFKTGLHEIQFGVEKSDGTKIYAIVIDPKTGKEIRIDIARPPAKGQLLVKAVLRDAEKRGNKAEPIDAEVDLLCRLEDTKLWKKTNKETRVKLDANGELLLCNAASGLWRVIGYKSTPIPACPQSVTDEDTTNVDLTKCERLTPDDTCPRGLTIDIETSLFRYEPAFPGPGG